MYIATIYFLILLQTNLAHQRPKIIGGSACKLDNKTSFMVALTDSEGFHWCGGSLINPFWVLSAAHCESEITLYASDVFTRGKFVDKEGVLSWWTPVIKIVEIIIHPEYKDIPTENDIALMKLERKMSLKKVHIVKLPTFKVSEEPPEFCPTAAIMGWGDIDRDMIDTPTHLQCAEIKTISNADCKNSYKIPTYEIFETNLCTEINEEKGTCYGDSGGPLMCRDVQYGIVSWAKGCAEKYPTVYTRVDHYLTFIHQHVTLSQRSATEGLCYSNLFLFILVLFNKI